jgi:hypothetical protein
VTVLHVQNGAIAANSKDSAARLRMRCRNRNVSLIFVIDVIHELYKLYGNWGNQVRRSLAHLAAPKFQVIDIIARPECGRRDTTRKMSKKL